MNVTLTPDEVRRAVWVGVERQLEARRLNLPDRHGFTGDGWGEHIEGAAGELAVAKLLGWELDATVNTFKAGGDLGEKVQVRTRSEHWMELIVRPDDRDGDYFVLVTGRIPRFRVRGWYPGGAAKRPEWLQSHGGRPPAFFVPQGKLKRLKVPGRRMGV